MSAVFNAFHKIIITFLHEEAAEGVVGGSAIDEHHPGNILATGARGGGFSGLPGATQGSGGMRRYRGNERAVSSARCLALAEAKSSLRDLAEGASKEHRSEAESALVLSGPGIEAPEKPQQPCQRQGVEPRRK